MGSLEDCVTPTRDGGRIVRPKLDCCNVGVEVFVTYFPVTLLTGLLPDDSELLAFTGLATNDSFNDCDSDENAMDALRDASARRLAVVAEIVAHAG